MPRRRRGGGTASESTNRQADREQHKQSRESSLELNVGIESAAQTQLYSNMAAADATIDDDDDPLASGA